VTTFGWELPAGERNEALDTMLQAEAAAVKLGVRDMPPGMWDRYEDERASEPEGPPDPEPEPPPVAPPPAAPPPATFDMPRRTGFLGARRRNWL